MISFAHRFIQFNTVKYFLLSPQGFKDYVEIFLKGHEDETGNQIKPIYEMCSERWEVAVAVSDNGFQQVSDGFTIFHSQF